MSPTCKKRELPDKIDDELIALNVGGHKFLCFRGTLTWPSDSYLAVRFRRDSKIPPGGYIGKHEGVDTYFIDRDGDVFMYIMTFLRTGTLELLPFATHSDLWRTLRKEANFYLLDGLSNLLHVTSKREFMYTGDNNGVFYWLGTSHARGPSDDQAYYNPVRSKLVRLLVSESQTLPLIETQCFVTDRVKYARRVEDPECTTDDGSLMIYAMGYEDFLPCDAHMQPSVCWIGVQLRFCEVQITHYTLHVADCHGASDWNLEASHDGKKWVILHEVRFDTHLYVDPRSRTYRRMCVQLERKHDQQHVRERMSHTYKVPQNNDRVKQFYSYFRIASLPADEIQTPERQDTLNEEWHTCIHVCGFEIYGDVHES